jgi:hypothetical protein
MDHQEQAHRLRRAIREARVNIEHSCRDDLTQDELIFRMETITAVLLIASQELTALIENWRGVSSAGEYNNTRY